MPNGGDDSSQRFREMAESLIPPRSPGRYHLYRTMRNSSWRASNIVPTRLLACANRGAVVEIQV